MKSVLDRLTVFEKYWLAFFSVIILAATLYFSYTGTKWDDWKSIMLNWVISPLSAFTGVVCVVLCAKGKLSNWVWGFVNSLTYGLVAWVSGYYGDWMLNWFFFIPTQILIYFWWKKNLIENSTIVKMKNLGKKGFVVPSIAIVSTIVFAMFLMNVDNFFTESMKRSSIFYGNLEQITHIKALGPLLDSSTVVLQVVAEICLIMMLAEQWPLWIATNVISIFIWSIIIITDPTSYAYAVPTLIMWIAFLTNSVYGAYNWYRSR